jgi:hypothetical protein
VKYYLGAQRALPDGASVNVVDGQEALRFLVRVREFIEHPEDLLLEG